MKVVIFDDGGSGAEYLQRKINDWLSQHPKIIITHVCQTEYNSFITISIFYN